MDIILYKNLAYLVGNLKPCGRILSWRDVQNALTKGQWYECVEWLKHNAKDGLTFGENGSLSLNSNSAADTLTAKINKAARDAEIASYEKLMNIKVSQDTLRHNRFTRRMAAASLIVSLLVLLCSVAVPILTHIGIL